MKRDVALKLLRLDLADERSLERFESERQALASMEHPGIARIFDGGAFEGRPWFAMEYAAGVSIDAKIRHAAWRLGTRERVLDCDQYSACARNIDPTSGTRSAADVEDRSMSPRAQAEC